MQEVVVVAKPDTATEAVQLVRRQKSATVSDAISAEQMARTPDTNASEAVKRVVGATIQDGKYVIVRGLGGRYSLTLLNGVALPSPDPDLPSGAARSVPGGAAREPDRGQDVHARHARATFAGGALHDRDARLPVAVHAQAAPRNARSIRPATFRQVNTLQGRIARLPRLRRRHARAARSPSPRQTCRLAATDPLFTRRGAGDDGAQRSRTTGISTSTGRCPNWAWAATIGDTVTVAGRKLGYLAIGPSTATAGRGSRPTSRWSAARDRTRSYTPSPLQLDSRHGHRRSSTSAGLLNVGCTLSRDAPPRADLALHPQHRERGDGGHRSARTNGNFVDRLRFRFLERMMQFNQLTGEHAFLGGRLLLELAGPPGVHHQHEPDTRDPAAPAPRGRRRLPRSAPASAHAERTFGELHDDHRRRRHRPHRPVPGDQAQGRRRVSSLAARVARAAIPLRGARRRDSDAVVAGGVRARQHQAGRRRVRRGDDAKTTRSTPTAASTTRYLMGGSRQPRAVPRDRRRALRCRADGSDAGQIARHQPGRDHQTHQPPRPRRPARPSTRSTRSPGRFEPARRLRRHRRAPTPARAVADAVLRLRPPARGRRQPEPARRPTSTTPTCAGNCSRRSSEVLAASTFYKYLEHPIERTAEPAGDGTNLNFENADNAQEWGFELEARVSGGRIRPDARSVLRVGQPHLHHFASQEMAPAIDGVGTVTTTRPLQGQSPYVVNAEIGYRKGGTQLSLLYNVIGPRLIEVGTAGAGDVYEQAFHRLDATWNQKLPHGLTLKISGTNLLNQRFSLRQGNKGDNHGVGDLRLPPRRRWSGVFGMVLRRNKQVSKQGDTAMTTKNRNVFSATAFGAGAVGLGLLALGLAMTGPACSDSMVSTPGTAGSNARGGTTGTAGTGGDGAGGTGGDGAGGTGGDAQHAGTGGTPAAIAGSGGTGGGTAGTGGGAGTGGTGGAACTSPQTIAVAAAITADVTWTPLQHVPAPDGHEGGGARTGDSDDRARHRDQGQRATRRWSSRWAPRSSPTGPRAHPSSSPATRRWARARRATGAASSSWARRRTTRTPTARRPPRRRSSRPTAPPRPTACSAAPIPTTAAARSSTSASSSAASPTCPNREWNNFTFCGVGRGTVDRLHPVAQGRRRLRSSSSAAPSTSSTSSSRQNEDDGFDTDNGWQGKAQFVVIQHVAPRGTDASNGYESDNHASAPSYTAASAHVAAHLQRDVDRQEGLHRRGELRRALPARHGRHVLQPHHHEVGERRRRGPRRGDDGPDHGEHAVHQEQHLLRQHGRGRQLAGGDGDRRHRREDDLHQRRPGTTARSIRCSAIASQPDGAELQAGDRLARPHRRRDAAATTASSTRRRRSSARSGQTTGRRAGPRTRRTEPTATMIHGPLPRRPRGGEGRVSKNGGRHEFSRLFPDCHEPVTASSNGRRPKCQLEANLDRKVLGRRGRTRPAGAADLQPLGRRVHRPGDRKRHRRPGGGAEVRARRRAAGSDAARHPGHRGLPADPRRRGRQPAAGGHDADRQGRGDRSRRRLRAGRRRLRRQAVQRARAGAARGRDHADPQAAARERRQPRRSAAATRSVRSSSTSTATTCS